MISCREKVDWSGWAEKEGKGRRWGLWGDGFGEEEVGSG